MKVVTQTSCNAPVRVRNVRIGETFSLPSTNRGGRAYLMKVRPPRSSRPIDGYAKYGHYRFTQRAPGSSSSYAVNLETGIVIKQNGSTLVNRIEAEVHVDG